jgi:uncharacterized membrane protein YkoI
MPTGTTRRLRPFTHRTIFAVLALWIWATLSSAADDVTEARRLRDAGIILPLETIIERAVKEHSGHVIATEFEPRDGLYIYEIEILDGSGTVWELEYDAAHGNLLAHKKENN